MTRTPQALLSNTAKEDNLTVLLPIRNPTRASAATPGIYPPPLGSPAYLWSVKYSADSPSSDRRKQRFHRKNYSFRQWQVTFRSRKSRHNQTANCTSLKTVHRAILATLCSLFLRQISSVYISAFRAGFSKEPRGLSVDSRSHSSWICCT